MVKKTSMYCTTKLLSLAIAALFLVAGAHAWQKDSMPGMDMSGKNDMKAMDMKGMDMKDMGPSMAAMAGHMIVTPLRPVEPGDEDKAKAVIAQAKATMERYQNYKNALADGYVWAHPEAKQTQYHFENDANSRAAETTFDRPSPPPFSIATLRTSNSSWRA